MSVNDLCTIGHSLGFSPTLDNTKSMKYNAATGSHLKAPQPEGGPRKKSFCARMSGMPGPMKDENGKPTRKAASLKRWKCGS